MPTMKPMLNALTILLMAVGLFGCTATSTFDMASAPSPRPLKPIPTHCPYGHTALKEVPVVYGLLMWTPELEKQAENLEFLSGGCVEMAGVSPKVVYICTTCRFKYNPVAGDWEGREKGTVTHCCPEVWPVTRPCPTPPDGPS